MKARAFRSTLLTGFSIGSQNLIRLGGNLILTRVLFPEAFGLMAIVYVILGAVRTFSDIGLTAVIVQDKDGDNPLFLNTAWVLQIIRGILLALLIWALATPIANFYEQPELAQILPIIGIAICVEGFNSTQLATARRHLLLGRLTALELTKQVIGLCATILLVFFLQSVWALVYGFLVSTLIMAVLSHLMLPGHTNRPAFHMPYLRRMFRFGIFIFVSSAGSFLLTQGDRVVLGKIVALDELGLYTIAYFLATVPILLSQALSSKVVFPLYSRRDPRESEANRQNLFKMRRLITAITFLGLVFFALIGEPLVRFLYDPRYEGAGQLVALLAIAHLPMAIVTDHRQVVLAAGHSGRHALISVVFAVVQMGTMLWFGSLFGLNGVILGIALTPLLVYPLLILLVYPYRGWDVLHDLGFSILFVGFVVLESFRGAIELHL